MLGVQVPPPVLSATVRDECFIDHRSVVGMKSDTMPSSFFECLLQQAAYKITQGILVRRLVFLALAICVLVFCQQFYVFLTQFFSQAVSVAYVGLIALSGIWISYRLVQYPPVANFLIDVQLESSKVSWSTWPELCRTTAVVLAAMTLFSLFLFACDVSWQFLLRLLTVLNV